MKLKAFLKLCNCNEIITIIKNNKAIAEEVTIYQYLNDKKFIDGKIVSWDLSVLNYDCPIICIEIE